jgi:hypothetical protein
VVSARWAACRELTIETGESMVRVPSAHSSLPLSSGVYDTLRADLHITDVRSMAEAARIVLHACEDRLVVRRANRDALRAFVERFDSVTAQGRRLRRSRPPPTPIPDHVRRRTPWPAFHTTLSPAVPPVASRSRGGIRSVAA